MANGDAAAAAGMDVVPGTADLRQGYDEDNKTRDYLAAHQTGGTHPASAITSGVLDVARIPVLPASKAPTATRVESGGTSLDGTTIPGQFTASGGLGVLGAFAALGQITLPDTYTRSVSGHGGFGTLNVAADGLVGRVTSSARYKQDIVTAEIPRATLRAFRVTLYRYIADVDAGTDQLYMSAIAEEVHDLGLTFLVDYDEEGRPEGLNDRGIGYLGLLLAQDAEDRIDELTLTVYDLAADVLALKGGA